VGRRRITGRRLRPTTLTDTNSRTWCRGQHSPGCRPPNISTRRLPGPDRSPNAHLLAAHGNKETNRHLGAPRCSTGRYLGTMCLSEPHAGSSLRQHHGPSGPAGRRNISPSPAQRCGSAAVITKCRTTSFISSWPRHPEAHRASKESRCSIVPKHLVDDGGRPGNAQTRWCWSASTTRWVITERPTRY